MSYLPSFIFVLLFGNLFGQIGSAVNIDSLYKMSSQKLQDEEYENSIYDLLRIINSDELKKDPSADVKALNVNKQIGFNFFLMENFTLAKYYFNEAAKNATRIGDEANPEMGFCMQYTGVCNYFLGKRDEVCDLISAGVLLVGVGNTEDFVVKIYQQLCMEE